MSFGTMVIEYGSHDAAKEAQNLANAYRKRAERYQGIMRRINGANKSFCWPNQLQGAIAMLAKNERFCLIKEYNYKEFSKQLDLFFDYTKYIEENCIAVSFGYIPKSPMQEYFEYVGEKISEEKEKFIVRYAEFCITAFKDTKEFINDFKKSDLGRVVQIASSGVKIYLLIYSGAIYTPKGTLMFINSLNDLSSNATDLYYSSQGYETETNYLEYYIKEGFTTGFEYFGMKNTGEIVGDRWVEMNNITNTLLNFDGTMSDWAHKYSVTTGNGVDPFFFGKINIEEYNASHLLPISKVDSDLKRTYEIIKGGKEVLEIRNVGVETIEHAVGYESEAYMYQNGPTKIIKKRGNGGSGI